MRADPAGREDQPVEKDQLATALKWQELAASEREFYTKRFESGQQRGLLVLSTSAGVVALLGALSAFLPETAPALNPVSVLCLVLSTGAFGVAAVLALIATGPAFSKEDGLEMRKLAADLKEGGEVGFVAGTTAGLLRQAEGIRRTGNKQARRVVLAIQCEAVAVTLLAAAVLIMALDEAGWVAL